MAWQWRLYPDNHAARANLLIHIVTVPLFIGGFVALVTAAFTVWWLALAGPLVMVLAMALQGRGHRLERVAPVPFSGPLDIVRRIFTEQLVTFPRYVVRGGFARAWKAASLMGR